MVVDDHLAGHRALEEGRDCVLGTSTAHHHAGDPSSVDITDREHLHAARVANGATKRLGGGGEKAHGRR
jgi:hypothetical protein